eukprot:TRINITY_DN24839_c0_g1_i2.p1 TRINITY_DN24839_c0_g1~~TRINITY_DN24839_c0_g1_i2.p1  ORF type:complete len:325 (+),score=81.48 TRINITY_DN24839_c0_g1_i2:63-1037(+)
MAPKKKPAAADGDVDVEEEINKCMSRFKSEYKRQCELLNITPITKLERASEARVLSWLALRNENLGPAGMTAIVEAVQGVEPKFGKIHELTIWKCDAGNAGAVALATLFRNRYCVNKVHFLENERGWEGCAALWVSCKANDHLKELVLNCNPLGDEGVAALTDGLRWNSCLEVLSLEYCGIGAYGASALAQDIIANDYCVLKDLDLKGNGLGPEGVAAIADGLKVNKTLITLSLADTQMGDNMVPREALREALLQHPVLEGIDLNLNNIGPEGGGMLLEVLSQNKNLKNVGVFERLGALYREIKDKADENGSKKKKKGKKKKKK